MAFNYNAGPSQNMLNRRNIGGVAGAPGVTGASGNTPTLTPGSNQVPSTAFMPHSISPPQSLNPTVTGLNVGPSPNFRMNPGNNPLPGPGNISPSMVTNPGGAVKPMGTPNPGMMQPTSLTGNPINNPQINNPFGGNPGGAVLPGPGNPNMGGAIGPVTPYPVPNPGMGIQNLGGTNTPSNGGGGINPAFWQNYLQQQFNNRGVGPLQQITSGGTGTGSQ